MNNVGDDRKRLRKRKSKMRRTTAQAEAAVEARKVMVELPGPFVEKVDQLAEALRISRSQLIRDALDARLKQVEKEKRRQQYQKAYLANSQSVSEVYGDLEPLIVESLSSDPSQNGRKQQAGH
jgi:predicted transcriptional regulator